jgi:hypothetical protein
VQLQRMTVPLIDNGKANTRIATNEGLLNSEQAT